MIFSKQNQLVCNFKMLISFYNLVIIAPGVVEDLNAFAQTSTSMIVSWNNPLCPNGNIQSFIVYYRTSNLTQHPMISSVGYYNTSVSSTHAVIDDLIPNNKYTVHVRAVSKDGINGEAGEEVLVQLTDIVTLPNAIISRLSEETKVGVDYIEIGLPTESDFDSIGIKNITYVSYMFVLP